MSGLLEQNLDYAYTPVVRDAILTADQSLCVIGELRLEGLNEPADMDENLAFVSYRARTPGRDWQKTITLSNERVSMGLSLEKVREDSRGNFYLAGYHSSVDQGKEMVRLSIVKMSKTGGILWWKDYTIYNDYAMRGISLLVSESGVYLAYTKTNFARTTALLIMKIDPDGRLLFQHEYGHDNIFYYCTGMTETSDGNVLLTGYGSQAEYSGIILLLLSNAGELLWQKRCHGDWSDIQIDTMRELPDRDIVIAGSVRSREVSTGFEEDAFIARIAPDGTFVWRNRLVLRRQLGTAQGIVMDGDEMVIGYSSAEKGEQHPIIVRCALSGENAAALSLMPEKLGGTQIPDNLCYRLFMLDRLDDSFILGVDSCVNEIPFSVTFLTAEDLPTSSEKLSEDVEKGNTDLYNEPTSYFSFQSASEQDFHGYKVSPGIVDFWPGHAWDPGSPSMKWLAEHAFRLAPDYTVIESGIINDNDVNFRQSPSVEAKVLSRLQFETKVEVLNRGSFKTAVKDMTDYWYKVKTADGTVGWVYGRYLWLKPAYQGTAGG